MSQLQRSGAVSRPERRKSADPVHLISEGELSLDLINSEHFDYRGRKEPRDYLVRPEWMQSFAQRWHLPVTSSPGTFDLAALRILRTLLRQMFEDVTVGRPLTDAQIEELNAILALTPMLQQAQRVGNEICLETIPLQTGWTSVLTQAAVSWVDFLNRTPSRRLKICANPVCHWVFVDQSHNLSRRWCRQEACGNLMKVRQFRAQRATQTIDSV